MFLSTDRHMSEQAVKGSKVQHIKEQIDRDHQHKRCVQYIVTEYFKSLPIECSRGH